MTVGTRNGLRKQLLGWDSGAGSAVWLAEPQCRWKGKQTAQGNSAIVKHSLVVAKALADALYQAFEQWGKMIILVKGQ